MLSILKSINRVHIAWFLFLLLMVFHFRIYDGYAISLWIEVLFNIALILIMWFTFKLLDLTLEKEEERRPRRNSSARLLLEVALLGYALLFIPGYLLAYIVEKDFFQSEQEEKYGVVCPTVVYTYGTDRTGYYARVKPLNDDMGKCRIAIDKHLLNHINRKDTLLVVHPKLKNEKELFHFNLYYNSLYEEKPNSAQVEYCMDSPKMSDKIRSLKNVPTKDGMMDFLFKNENHTIKVISAVVEKKSKSFTFFDVPQSDELLFAHRRFISYSEQQKVLIAYDVDKIQAFYVCNPSPSDEEYEQYKTPTGLPLPPKYSIAAIRK